MSLKDVLTPKDTEEVRPEIFVQSTITRSGRKCRVINPICWKGRYRWKKQFSWKNLITIVIILFLAWSYFNETSYCRELQEDPCQMLPNITIYCLERSQIKEADYGKEKYPLIIQNYP